jgi:alanyl-tRNA synthetase
MSSPTTIRTAARIRSEFLEFFAQKLGHTVVPSSPVVPRDDPTLLFTNAGMNQFKDVFLGRGERPYVRAVNSQKCIRAGGKHNDLEDVGRDGYHHTFFEMLGNWSFGDYFKPEAIAWAWELLTSPDHWGLDPDRLYVTVFEGNAAEGLEPDVEAEDIWKGLVAADRISRWGKKDNFWEMGDQGPCGPCSEIHYDGRSDDERAKTPGADLVNRDHPDVVEVWNLVFIQFDRSPPIDGRPGALTPLPARHVDTGMGLERITRIVQGVPSNYDTDLWQPIFKAIAAHTGAHPYAGSMDDPIDTAYRVIADHVRCLTIAITDGARPGADGRSYVLRRILRRAVRLAHQTLSTTGAWLHELVPTVVETLGPAFPELSGDPQHVADVIREEEESFLRTLDRGIALFDDAARRVEGATPARITAEDAFKLHDTFGFPIDLTRVMAEERGLAVDEEGYERLMEEARTLSRRGGEAEQRLVLPPDAIARLRHLGVVATHDEDKHHGRPVTATVKAIWNGRDFDEITQVTDVVGLVLNRTNHYAEAGGQVGDRGAITTVNGGRFEVDDTQAFGEYVLHIGRVVEGPISVGDETDVAVEREFRLPVLANHTGTHLLNHALRAVLGDDTDQRGSLVAPDRLRFDFVCPHAMSPEQIEQVETLVNEAIAAALPVHAEVVPLADAQRIHGVRAVFGEHYPDPVRVVCIGQAVATLLERPDDPAWRDYSVEFCGGTHLVSTDEADRLVIVHEQALAAGVRRIQAVTGAAAIAAERAGADLEGRVDRTAGLAGAELVSAHEDLTRLVDEMTLGTACRQRIREKLDGLRQAIHAAKKSAQSEARKGAVAQAQEIAERSSGAEVIVERVDGADKETLMSAVDVIRAKCPESAAMLFAPDEEAGKVSIVAVVPKPLIERGLRAGDWVRQAAQVCGGGGGGRPDMAQAGGKDPSKVPAAIDASCAFAQEKLA